MNTCVSWKLAGLGLFFAAALCGCASNILYRVKMIPRTPENLAAYRDCQRTFAVATGYEADGFANLKRQCLSTLQGIVSKEAVGPTSAYESIRPSSATCSVIESVNFYARNPIESEEYYFCDPPR